jgi:hypothetical protein
MRKFAFIDHNIKKLRYMSAFYIFLYVWIFLSARNLWTGYFVICRKNMFTEFRQNLT